MQAGRRSGHSAPSLGEHGLIPLPIQSGESILLLSSDVRGKRHHAPVFEQRIDGKGSLKGDLDQAVFSQVFNDP
jgi:hypothetical protein